MSLDALDELGFEGRKSYPDYLAKPSTDRTSSGEDGTKWLLDREKSGEIIECKRLKARHPISTCLTLKKKAAAGNPYANGERASSADLMPCATCDRYEFDLLVVPDCQEQDEIKTKRSGFVGSTFNSRRS